MEKKTLLFPAFRYSKSKLGHSQCERTGSWQRGRLMLSYGSVEGGSPRKLLGEEVLEISLENRNDFNIWKFKERYSWDAAHGNFRV